MQFAYLFPEYVERMVLICSGGLGKEVHPLLRAAILPGSEWVMPLMAREWSVNAGDAVAQGRRQARPRGRARPRRVRPRLRLAGRAGSARRLPPHDAQRDRPRRPAGLALDRLYLADQMPTLLIWGTDDPVIPVDHGRNAHEIVTDSRYVEIEGSGHWPMLDAPDRVVARADRLHRRDRALRVLDGGGPRAAEARARLDKLSRRRPRRACPPRRPP